MSSLKYFFVVFSIPFVFAGVDRGLSCINGDVKRLDTEKFLSCVAGTWVQKAYKENDHFPLGENLNRTRRDVESDDAFDQIGDVLTTIQNGGRSKQKPANSVFPWDCGIINVSPNDGGSTIEQTPWLVALMFLSDRSPFCSGVIISENFVLTSARCYDSSGGKPESSDYIFAGDTRIQGRDREYNITRFIIHPKFDKKDLINDIALIEISGKFRFSNTIQPICMPHHELYEINRQVLFTGWVGENKVVVKMNREVNDIMGKADCLKLYGNEFTPGMFCAVDRTADHSCLVQLGGPLFTNAGVHHYLLGVFSWSRSGCDSNKYPKVYTKVIDYIEWIREVMTGEK